MATKTETESSIQALYSRWKAYKKLEEQYGDDHPEQRDSIIKRYVRDPYVVEQARMRADGICQLCGKPAPFWDKSGNPYLEVHHVKWLSKGGEDKIYNAVALCPNCHTKMHIAPQEEDEQFLLCKAHEDSTP